MISTEKFGLWFMAPAEWNITLVVLFFNKCSGGKQIFTLSGKYWKLIRERGCWPGMPGISTGGRGHYCPNYDDCYDGCSYETMALWHRRIHRQRHRGLYTAPHLSRSGHAVLATSTHYSPASGLGIIQIQYTLSSDYRDLCRGSFIVTVLSYTIQVDVSSIVLRMFL